MKIDMVLTAGNLNGHHTRLFPLIHQVWKKRFNLDCYLILIAPKIPDFLQDYQDYIILFQPILEIHDVFVAQVIRLLYPVMYPDKNVLITDLDILPVQKSYFIDPIKHLHHDTFVTWTDRYVKQKMYAICYNCSKGRNYGKMFNVTNLEEITQKLKDWYQEIDGEYIARKNCPGWYTDQQKLFIHFNAYSGQKVCLDESTLGFNRLMNRQINKEYIVKNFTEILNTLENYSDIHCLKPYSKNKHYLEMMTQKLINI